jgi:hypothetical protein
MFQKNILPSSSRSNSEPSNLGTLHILQNTRWRQYISYNFQLTSTRLHGITSQKIALFSHCHQNFKSNIQMKGVQNKIYLRKHLLHTWVTPLQRQTMKVFISVYNFLSKFQCGLPWWHDKYSDIHPHSTLVEA